MIVIHSAEAFDDSGADTTAEGVANYFHTVERERGASTQLAVDRDSCVRMLPDLVIPWGASGANHDGLHVEICGRAGWSEAAWLRRTGMLRRAAYRVAKWSWLYDIPVRWVTNRQLAGGSAKGMTTHVQVNDVFKRGVHWDPGPGFPRDQFLRWVAEYREQIEEDRGNPDR